MFPDCLDVWTRSHEARWPQPRIIDTVRPLPTRDIQFGRLRNFFNVDSTTSFPDLLVRSPDDSHEIPASLGSTPAKTLMIRRRRPLGVQTTVITTLSTDPVTT